MTTRAPSIKTLATQLKDVDRVQHLTTLIECSLCLTTSNLGYARTLEAIKQLRLALKSSDVDESVRQDEGNLLPITSIIVGAYWFCAHNNAGQGSDEYSVLSVLDYEPGALERGPEYDTSEHYVYCALADLRNS